MSREEQERQKAFLENLDRMLGGEPAKDGPALDDDLKSALRMAEHLQRLGLTPSAEFKGELKARLLQKIYEKDKQAQEKQGWFWRWIPRQIAWQAVSAVALILVVVGIMWGVGVFRPSHQASISETAAQTGPKAAAPSTTTTPATTAPTARTTTTAGYGAGTLIAASAGTDKTSYARGEDVKIQVELKNTSVGPITIDRFPPILSLMQTDTKQPVYTFAAGTATRTIAAGETVKFSLDWGQQDSKGAYVAAGSYYIELEDVNSQGQTLQLNLATPPRFIIQSGAAATTGETVRTVTVDSTQTVDGITVVLQKIELTAAGARVYAFVTPPSDYSFVPGNPPRATQDYSAPAYYSLDGGWFKDAGTSSVEYLVNGMNHVWVIKEPLPADASEMQFSIAGIGQWKDTWRFTIALKP